MEQLRTEPDHLLDEKLNRVKRISEEPAMTLWSLYDARGDPMPLLARSFATPGMARQLAWKISALTRSGTVHILVVYSVMTHEEHPGLDMLLLEHLRGVPVEAPMHTPTRWEQLQEQIVETLLTWHCQDSDGCVGMVGSAQDNLWSSWYRQRVEMPWSTLSLYQDTDLTMQDKRILFHSRECLLELLRGSNDNTVLVHGNLILCSMLRDPRNDQLLAMVGPGMMLQTPREHELFRLTEGGQAEQLLWRHLQQAPVSETFVWRR